MILYYPARINYVDIVNFLFDDDQFYPTPESKRAELILTNNKNDFVKCTKLVYTIKEFIYEFYPLVKNVEKNDVELLIKSNDAGSVYLGLRLGLQSRILFDPDFANDVFWNIYYKNIDYKREITNILRELIT